MKMFCVSRSIAALLLFAAAGRAFASVEDPSCTQTGPTQYKLSYTLTAPSHKVTISASTDPTGATGQTVITTTEQPNVTVSAGKPGQRMYFFLAPDVGETREVSIRHLELEGTPNFRDVGGYKTTDGRYTRWGLLYRAGVLTNLTPRDLKYLAQLDIHVVCDFRTDRENAESPEKWIESSAVTRVHYPIGNNSNFSVQSVLSGNPSAEDLRNRMMGIYADFVDAYGPAFAQAFEQVKNEHLPLLYHCSGGKDRTGMFTAFILLTLGVPQATVLQDYSLTSAYVTAPPASAAGQRAANTFNNQMSHYTSEQRKALMAADPAYILSALSRINSEYGSFDNYRRTVLRVSDEDRDRLRNKLLTNP